MRARITLFLTLLLSVCFLGCATPGGYDDAKVAMIKKDVTSEPELLSWFGPATTRTMAPDGSKILTWRFAPGTGRHASTPGRLEVRLGTDGRVMAYSGSAATK